MSNEKPTLMDLVRQLRERVGLFSGAMPISPKMAWEQALQEVDRLRTITANGWCGRCEESELWGGKTNDS